MLYLVPPEKLYALGLKMTEKHTYQFGCFYQNQATEYGHNVQSDLKNK